MRIRRLVVPIAITSALVVLAAFTSSSGGTGGASGAGSTVSSGGASGTGVSSGADGTGSPGITLVTFRSGGARLSRHRCPGLPGVRRNVGAADQKGALGGHGVPRTILPNGVAGIHVSGVMVKRPAVIGNLGSPAVGPDQSSQ